MRNKEILFTLTIIKIQKEMKVNIILKMLLLILNYKNLDNTHIFGSVEKAR